MEIASEKYNIDVLKSYVVGDIGMGDIVLAKNASCKGILVLTGYGQGSLTTFRHTWSNYDANIIAENVLEATKMI